ncbi:hypoxanthine phosphoribosyltransferase [Haematococcus lacustris]|uniref:Hypoxanthine phosphoribosyltransferase n=1 Tax=Haematococcus lacustris TaxID=44745 RepID=A0A699YNF0_HAELA|nr:hypoxanthine phosphoribosyltransferase [Haematococcus lacustris]
MMAANGKPCHNVHQDIESVLFSADQIRDKVDELGRLVVNEYHDKQPVVMPILKGGFIVAADLVRALHPCPEGMVIDFIQASSYGAGTETSGRVEVAFDAAAVKNRHVLLVDDLCDSGLTLQEVTRHVREAGAASIKSLVLLDKKERRKVDYVPDFVGFDVGAGWCPNKWIVGHGMDTAQIYRSLPYIGVLRPEVQARYVTKK